MAEADAGAYADGQKLDGRPTGQSAGNPGDAGESFETTQHVPAHQDRPDYRLVK